MSEARDATERSEEKETVHYCTSEGEGNPAPTFLPTAPAWEEKCKKEKRRKEGHWCRDGVTTLLLFHHLQLKVAAVIAAVG